MGNDFNTKQCTFYDKEAKAVKADRPNWEINVSRRQNGFTDSVCIHKRNNAALYLYWFPYKDLGFPPRNPPLDYGPETTIVQGQFEDVGLVLWKASWLTQREILHSVFRECYWVTTWSSQLIQDCMILVTKGQTLMTQWEKKKSADNRPMNRSLKGLPVRMDVGSKQRHTWVDMWSRVLYKELMDGPLKRTLT